MSVFIPGSAVGTGGATSAASTTRGILFGLVAAVIWGAFLAFSRAGLINSGLSTPDIAFLRAVGAGSIFLPWLIVNRQRVRAGLRPGQAAIYAMCVGPPFVLIGISGYYFAPLVHGAVFIPGALVIMGAVMAAVVLGETRPAGVGAGIAVIAAGLLLIAAPGLFALGPRALIGDVLFWCAGTLWAAFSIIFRRDRVEPVIAVAGLSVLSLAVYGPVYLLIAGTGIIHHVPASVLIVQLLVQGVLTGAVAMLSYSLSVRHLGAGRAALFPALVPVFALCFGIPLTGEWLSALEWIAVVIIGAGLLASTRGWSVRS